MVKNSEANTSSPITDVSCSVSLYCKCYDCMVGSNFDCDCFIIFYNAGIGYALAKEFLKAGDNVIICSRSSKMLGFISHFLKFNYCPFGFMMLCNLKNVLVHLILCLLD